MIQLYPVRIMERNRLLIQTISFSMKVLYTEADNANPVIAVSPIKTPIKSQLLYTIACVRYQGSKDTDTDLIPTNWILNSSKAKTYVN